jgi:hypothetical protein
MSAQYYGSYPVKRITAISIVGQGVLIKTQKIVCKSSEVDSYFPTINSVFEDDSSLWVTDAKIDDQQNGLSEITVVAQGPADNSSTTMEVQPGGPLIYGLGGVAQSPIFWGISTTPDQSDYPSMVSPSAGATVKVSFIDLAGQENQIIESYSYKKMPATINSVSLPSYKEPGTYGNAILLPIPGQGFPVPDWRVFYKGYICKDIQIQRQGSALAVSLYFKESGFLEIYNQGNANNGTISKVWEY